MIPIAHIENDFPTKFGIPRQSGRVEALKARDCIRTGIPQCGCLPRPGGV